MSTSTTRRIEKARKSTAPSVPEKPHPKPDPAPELHDDLERMRREEEEKIERRRVEELARLRELARFD